MKMQPYYHKAQYYETDQMGIIHHSNYIRWFEEARIDFMSKCGLSYRQMEEEGIICPVVGVECSYKQSVKFGDDVLIVPYIKEYNGIKLTIGYNIYNADTKEISTIGESRHCFTKDNKIISLKKISPAFHNLFEELKKAEVEI